MKLMQPNIAGKGRAARAMAAVLTAVAAIVLLPISKMASAALAACAVFVGFEAARGWCVLRACGIKTRW